MNCNNNTQGCETRRAAGDLQDYWDAVFQDGGLQNWHQEDPKEISNYIEIAGIKPSSRILAVGVGNSTLIDKLLDQGHKNIIANDLSGAALDQLEERLGNTTAVSYIQDDLINPRVLSNYEAEVDLWIDRATLHFFVKCKQKETYFQLLDRSLAPGGHAIIGVFNKQNKPRCCGLDLQLWDEDSLIRQMEGYSLLASSNVAFEERNGNVRNYLYTLFRKDGSEARQI